MEYSIVSNNQITMDIKGIQEGLLVTFSEGSWEEIKASLVSRINEQEKFFKGAKIAIQ